MPCENMCLQFKIYVATTNINRTVEAAWNTSDDVDDDDDEKPIQNCRVMSESANERKPNVDNATKTRAPNPTNVTLLYFMLLLLVLFYPKSEWVFHVFLSFQCAPNHCHCLPFPSFTICVETKVNRIQTHFDKFTQFMWIAHSLIELELLMVNLSKGAQNGKQQHFSCASIGSWWRLLRARIRHKK